MFFPLPDIAFCNFAEYLREGGREGGREVGR